MNNEHEFNIGDKVFWARYANQPVTRECPVCFGNKEVTLVLGNGEQIKTACNYCEVGFSESTGVRTEYEYVSDVKEVVIDGKEVSENSEERLISYRFGSYVLDNQIFLTKAEAEEKVKEMISQTELDTELRAKNIRDMGMKKYSWHVGYHRKYIKDLEKQLEYHRRKVKEYTK